MDFMTKKDPKAFVTNEVLTETLDDAVDTLLKGMDNMLEEQKKLFVTKEDLKQFATKEDLKREISWVRDDIRGLTADISNVPTRKEFNELKGRVSKLETATN
jgi:hypothetical protein